jgi:hypothetical protein
MAELAPPPTHVPTVIEDDLTGLTTFSPQWMKWFLDNNAAVSNTMTQLADTTGANVATTYKALIPAKEAEGTTTKQYTAQNCTAIIDQFSVVNRTAGTVNLSVYLVTGGTTAGVGNLVYSNFAVVAGATVELVALKAQVIQSTGFISTIASVANSLTIRCSGRELK